MNLTTANLASAGTLPLPARPAYSDIAAGDGGARPLSPRLVTTGAGRLVTATELDALDATHSAANALVPAGTDPDLWRALTLDERSFFAHTPRIDAPVYDRRPGAPATDAAPRLRRGLHLDLRA